MEFDSLISMDAALVALIEAELERAQLAVRHRRLWILWHRFGWTVDQMNALPDHILDYAMRIGS